MEDKDKIIAELKAENEKLKLSERDLSRICQGFKKDIETEKSYALKYYKTLQEIREIAEKECKDCLDKRSDSCWICPYYPILDLITKAEEE